MVKKSKKLYHLGRDIKINDANRILGLPANAPLKWSEFQEYAANKKNKASSTKT
ncbi:MAG: hypothetical protein ABSF21_00305 [Dehalococcoidia bacterium]|jgi:hypothetical protein